MNITSAAVLIATALAVFGISYYYFTTRHKERMTILEKGLAPDFFKNTNYLPLLLLLGIVSIGISLGIVAGTVLKHLAIAGLRDFAFPFSLFFFLGFSLLAAYSVLKTINKKS